MSSEFNIIAKHFTRPTPQADLGVGDDAALFKVADGHQLVVSTDMSVAGTHFFSDAAPFDVGWKSLAVNVSDIAAMGAKPKWATLSIALPAIDETWLTEFSRGFFACADAFHLDLIGGDTTRGPLNISVTMMGEVPTGKALQRNGAKVGDDIWVSGTLGDAALALAILQNRYKLDVNDQEDAFEKWSASLHRPQPRVSLGMALRDIATSCIDISDGLLADLGHILSASNLGAEVHLEKLPMSLYLLNHLSESEIQKSVLAGGDDYELCFTAPASKRNEIELIGKQQNILLTCIATTTMEIGLRAKFKNNDLILSSKGFDHFG
jgi:thiamine-monophosphate kinase